MKTFKKKNKKNNRKTRNGRPEMFFGISHNSQENICDRVSFLIKKEISKNTYSYRTPLVDVSQNQKMLAADVSVRFRKTWTNAATLYIY